MRVSLPRAARRLGLLEQPRKALLLDHEAGVQAAEFEGDPAVDWLRAGHAALSLPSIKPPSPAKPFSGRLRSSGPGGEGLASSIICPRCGAANTAGTLFCVNCGSSLTATSGGAVGAPPGSPPAYPPIYPGAVPGMPGPMDAQHQKRINHTRTGVLLLLIGTLITGIAIVLFPVVQVVGSVFVVIGAILVILGRKAFGPVHSRYVVISIVVAIVGFVVTFFAGLVIGFAFVSASLPGGTPTQAGLQTALANSLIVGLIGTVIAGIASVLFTFALQDQTGRILCGAGYVSRIGIQVVLCVVCRALICECVGGLFRRWMFGRSAEIAGCGRLR